MGRLDTIENAERRFDRLIKHHRRLIRNLCWTRSVHDVALCADLVQHCYLALWQHLDDLQPDATRWQETSWVFWRCRHVISHRAAHRRPDLPPLDPSMADSLAVDTTDDDIRETLEELAVDLNEREHRYLQLNNEGYTAAEIAQAMQLTPNAVYVMRNRIIQKMRDTYQRTQNHIQP